MRTSNRTAAVVKGVGQSRGALKRRVGKLPLGAVKALCETLRNQTITILRPGVLQAAIGVRGPRSFLSRLIGLLTPGEIRAMRAALGLCTKPDSLRRRTA